MDVSGCGDNLDTGEDLGSRAELGRSPIRTSHTCDHVASSGMADSSSTGPDFEGIKS